jgi:16S rRNA (guanine527-N7)-methyltransferase
MTETAQDFSRTQDAPLLAELAHSMGYALASDTQEQLTRYVELVLAWNQNIDLTAARGAQKQLEVLLADALYLAQPTLVPEGLRLVDVGSGAGAPALALALARPDLHVTLVEPLRKRVLFLRTAVAKLECEARVTIIDSKLHTQKPKIAGMPFGLAVSRATFSPEVWVPLGLQLAPRTFAMLATKAAPEAPLGSQLSGTHDYTLPWSQARRSIAVYERVSRRG